MKKMLSWTWRNQVRMVGAFLILSVLTVGMLGCGERTSQDLEIRTWHDLDRIRHNLAGHHKLMNDLDATTDGYDDLAGPTANSKSGWRPIGTPDRGFNGTFDGQGYEIRDLFINRPYTKQVGLFSSVADSGVIRDVVIVNATVTGSDGVGCLAGSSSGLVTDSHVTGSVSGRAEVGKLVGVNGGIVINCNAAGNVTGGSTVGGLVGNDMGSLVNCHTSSVVTGDTSVGGLAGTANHVVNSSSTGEVSGEAYVGGLAGTARLVENSYSAAGVAGRENVGGLTGIGQTVNNSHYNYHDVLINGQNVITIGALFTDDFEQWIAQGRFLGIDGRLAQEDGYYVLHGVDDFRQLLAFGQDGSLRFRLKNNIDLAVDADFYIPYLAGDFDGNGYTVSNLSFSFSFVSHVGLFGYAGGRISALGVENVDVSGCRYVGGLAGRVDRVENSYATGVVTGTMDVGGLVGDAEHVQNSSSAVSVSGITRVGGLAGSSTWVYDSHSTGSVSGESNVGGLVGRSFQDVTGCYSTGSVDGYREVGGLVGYCTGLVRSSYSVGSVAGNEYVGGLVGWSVSTVHNCYSAGTVTAVGSERWYVGGLVGFNGEGGGVSNSYSSGSVTGGTYVGGLIGVNDGSVEMCYSSGIVSGDARVGGLIGYGKPADNSFWDIETSGQTSSAGGTGKTTAEMADIITFSDTATEGLDEPWDIIAVDTGGVVDSHIWNIVDGETYPFLSWQSG